MRKLHLEAGGEGIFPHAIIYASPQNGEMGITPRLDEHEFDGFIDSLISDLEKCRKEGHKFFANVDQSGRLPNNLRSTTL